MSEKTLNMVMEERMDEIVSVLRDQFPHAFHGQNGFRFFQKVGGDYKGQYWLTTRSGESLINKIDLTEITKEGFQKQIAEIYDKVSECNNSEQNRKNEVINEMNRFLLFLKEH